MAEQDIAQEIEQLKKQLAELAGKDRASSASSDAGPEEEARFEGANTEAGAWIREALRQAEELVGGLDLQLKDVPAKTALVIFALGVLTGRLLSRRG